MTRLLWPLLGLALAPTAFFVAQASLLALGRAAQGKAAYPFLAGLAVYPLLRALGPRPAWLYVLGHELTHAAAAVFSGARVKKMKVTGSGGHVLLDRSNFLIALAPYVVPLYAVLWLAGTRLAQVWYPLPSWVLAGGLGFWLSFHFVSTAGTLWQEHQTDLDAAGGVVHSMAWIVLGNSLLLLCALKLLHPHALSVKGALRAVAGETAMFWSQAGVYASQAASWTADQAGAWWASRARAGA